MFVLRGRKGFYLESDGVLFLSGRQIPGVERKGRGLVPVLRPRV